MIVIDTNVLLRYLLDDDPAQAKKANDLINGDQTVLVSDVVLVETIWTLKPRKISCSRFLAQATDSTALPKNIRLTYG